MWLRVEDEGQQQGGREGGREEEEKYKASSATAEEEGEAQTDNREAQVEVENEPARWRRSTNSKPAEAATATQQQQQQQQWKLRERIGRLWERDVVVLVDGFFVISIAVVFCFVNQWGASITARILCFQTGCGCCRPLPFALLSTIPS